MSPKINYFISAITILFVAAFSLTWAEQVAAEDDRIAVLGNFWKPDNVIWGDGRPEVVKPGPKNVPHGFKSEWQIQVPGTGWYELYLVGGGREFTHDLYLDGKAVYQAGTTDNKEKARNLWLNKGPHSLRIQRVGRSAWPKRFFDHFELRRSDNTPGTTISATKTLVDIMRTGEDFVIEVTGGGSGKASVYEILSFDFKTPKEKPQKVAEVKFSASSKPKTKTVKIKCPREGAFNLTARIKDGRDLGPAEFQIGQYAVVDVTNAANQGEKPVLLFEIDCVKQTLNGKPIAGEDFVECNGPTRVTKSALGSYRESHDGTPPEAGPPAPDSHVGYAASFSGFSYKLPPLPKLEVPYLLEIEYPDDDQRSFVMGSHFLDPETGYVSLLSNGYQSKSVQTGGMFPLSNNVQVHRDIFWPKTTSALISIFSQEIGTRAGVTKIRLSYFPGGNLPLPKLAKNGRNFINWYEEAFNWQTLVGYRGMIVNELPDYLEGLNRWAQFVRYHGGTGISALGTGYQEAFWRNTHLTGFQPAPYDRTRLLALICEKYGLSYMPEIFTDQGYLSQVELPGRAEHPDDIRSVNAHGAKSGTGYTPSNLNPIHPEVQKIWIDGLGELADKLRDCKSFTGIALRSQIWQFRGDFHLPGLGWGYNDWIIRQFEKDTGLKVPGALDDPKRFMKRYDFLTSDANRDRWINWRCDRLLDYHKRIRDRIRGNRDEVKLVFWGDFKTDAVYKTPDNVLLRMKEAGLDLEKMRRAGNIAIMPGARYGSRYTTAETQASYDEFFDPDYAKAGMGAPRAFAFYHTYIELSRVWPAGQLGLKLPPGTKGRPFHCTASLGAGRNSLEKFAVILGNQDSSLLMDGGNADTYGDPEIWQAWFAEYNALPQVPFKRVESAHDPVAVWQRKNMFYVVNMARWPITIDISFSDAAKVSGLASGEKIPLQNNDLKLMLKPFELRSFRIENNARIVATNTIIPQEMHTYIHDRMAFAQKLYRGLDPDAIPEAERKAYEKALATAWDALERKRYWRARSVLRSAPMMRVYELTASMPEGQIVGKFPNLMRDVRNMGHWNLAEPMISVDELKSGVKGRIDIASSNSFNSEWGGYRVLKTDNGEMTMTIASPAAGRYTLQLGLVAESPAPIIVELGQTVLPMPASISKAKQPGTASFQNVMLNGGEQELTLRRPDGKTFGLYGIKILPAMRPLGSKSWSVAGPFTSFWGKAGSKLQGNAAVKKGMETVYPPERNTDINAVYTDTDGRELRWEQPYPNISGSYSERGINMSGRTGSPGRDFNFALTYIYSDKDQEALLILPCDWWARATINGERIRTNATASEVDATGADFNTYYPNYRGVFKLKKGENKLLIKQQGGSGGSGFSAYISDLSGVEIAPVPKK